MQDSLRIAERIGIASNAHFWKTHDIDTLARACLKIGMGGRQILINSAFFTVHLDQAKLDDLHSNLLSFLELMECLVLTKQLTFYLNYTCVELKLKIMSITTKGVFTFRVWS